MYVYVQFLKGKYKETYIRKTTDLKCLTQGSGVADNVFIAFYFY